jgi:hypothetical protein
VIGSSEAELQTTGPLLFLTKEKHTMKSGLRFVRTVAFLLLIPIASPAQSGGGRIAGPSGAQVAGAVAGVAGITVVILYFTLRKPSITGCVQTTGGSTQLTNESDKRTYALVDDVSNLKPGERFKLKGKKIKEKDGTFSFRVKRVGHDYGACSQ